MGTGLKTEIARLRQSQLLMLIIGSAALFIGTLIYILDRPANLVYFVPDSWQFAESTPLLFGMLGNFLPAFLHAFAFALFVTAIAGRRRIGLLCAGWFVVEVCLELAQVDTFAFLIAGMLPAWFADSLLLENVQSHFVTGRFDAIDVLFLALGCATAWLLADRVLPQPDDHPPSAARISRPVRLAALLIIALVGLTSTLGSGGTGNTVMAEVAAAAGAAQ